MKGVESPLVPRPCQRHCSPHSASGSAVRLLEPPCPRGPILSRELGSCSGSSGPLPPGHPCSSASLVCYLILVTGAFLVHETSPTVL